MPPPKTRPASPFQGSPGPGWRPTRTRPALKRERTGEPATAKDDAAAAEEPATGIAGHGSGSSRKI